MKNILSAAAQSGIEHGGAGREPELDFLFIGELAQETGSNPKTIRFYEREGLITPMRHGRFRVYSRENERQLKSVLRMRAMGIHLAQIREILTHARAGEDPLTSARFASLLKTHLGELGRRRSLVLAEIEAAEEALQKFELRQAS